MASRPTRGRASGARRAREDTRRALRAGRAFARLTAIMATLRSPRGCPWDREQTPQSLRPFLLEETYEALDAIDRNDTAELQGELGDVLFQCVFQAQIASEHGQFEIADSIEAIVAKLVRRHPHVFTPAGRPLPAGERRGKARTPARVLEQWERIKAREQADSGATARLLAGVPRALPALARAHEIGTRVAAVGFDWNRATDVVAKMEEETRELGEAVASDPARTAEELGDVLFTLASLARKLNVDPESALREANDKFTRRFQSLEDWLRARGRSVHDATPAEMEHGWAAVKEQERSSPTTSVPQPSAPATSIRRSQPRSRRPGRS